MYITWRKLCVLVQRRFYNRETIPFARKSPLAESGSTLPLLAEILELRRVKYLSRIKGKGVRKTFGVFHNLMWQLFLYCTISFVSIKKYVG